MQIESNGSVPNTSVPAPSVQVTQNTTIGSVDSKIEGAQAEKIDDPDFKKISEVILLTCSLVALGTLTALTFPVGLFIPMGWGLHEVAERAGKAVKDE